MKLLTFRRDGADAAGLVEWAAGAPEVTVDVAALELLAPIPRPPSLRDAIS